MNKQLNKGKEEAVGKYISVIYRYMNSLMDKELEVYDIDRGQFPFLIPLYHREGVSQNELCQFYKMDKAAAVRALNKLEKNGYVIRMTDPDDKRQHQIYLTKKAKIFEPQLYDIIKNIEKKILKDIDEQDKKQLKITLKKIGNSLGLIE